MTPELGILLAVMVFAASMWIPYIVGVNLRLPEGIDPFAKPFDHAVLPPWVQRADRAHLNLLEQAMPFAAVVLVAHSLGATSAATVWASAAFLALRVIHAVGMTTGVLRYPARPIVFTLGWVCILVLAAEIVRLA